MNRPYTTYLIGSVHAFRRFCASRKIRLDDPAVTHIESAEVLRHVVDGQIVFLKDWETLTDARELYNLVIGHRTAQRLAEENA